MVSGKRCSNQIKHKAQIKLYAFKMVAKLIVKGDNPLIS